MGKGSRRLKKEAQRKKRISAMPDWKRQQRYGGKKKHLDGDWSEPKNNRR